MAQVSAQDAATATGTWSPCTRLMIVLGHGELFHRYPLYAEIVHRAHRHGLAGASVLAGTEGFGESCLVHASRARSPLSSARGSPIAVVIVDSRARVEQFLPQLADVADRILVTTSPGRLQRCTSGPQPSWWHSIRDWWTVSLIHRRGW